METVVISLGGSVVVPKQINVEFLKAFSRAILDKRKATRFIIVVGGGSIARDYIDAAKSIGTTPRLASLDWLGIEATVLNATLVKTIFQDNCYESVITNPTKKVRTDKNIIVAAGWKPGFSTDYDAAMLAKSYGAKLVINITNVDYVYDKDPTKYKDSLPIERLSWKQFFGLVDTKWTAGLHSPFDPIAARKASVEKMTVYIIGKDIVNLLSCVENKKCKGTIIS